MQLEGPLLLVGGGKMGGALLDGWLARGISAGDVIVVEPAEAGRTALAAKGVRAVADASELSGSPAPSVIVLAVKPQVMDAVVPPYARFAAAGSVFLSVAAGRTLGFFAQHLGASAAVVRTIPNTPAAVGRGMTVLCANSNVDAAARKVCDELMRGVGETGWVEDEALIDAATAVGGSGPAYVFYMIECMANAGIAAGLPEDLARRIARQTVCGAGELAWQSEEPPEQLRKNVTSPGGTTAAALDVLMAEDGLQPLVEKAVDAAVKRSRELAG